MLLQVVIANKAAEQRQKAKEKAANQQIPPPKQQPTKTASPIRQQELFDKMVPPDEFGEDDALFDCIELNAEVTVAFLCHSSPADLQVLRDQPSHVPQHRPAVPQQVHQGSSHAALGEIPQCDCGMPCVERTSRSEKNPGRKFYCCSLQQNDPQRCKTFIWVDEQSQTRSWPPAQQFGDPVMNFHEPSNLPVGRYTVK